MLQLHVKGIDGKTYTVNLMSEKTLVSEVKMHIKDKTGIQPDSQRLIYGGRQMEDHKYLDHYPPLHHGATIYLVLRLPGGSLQTPVIRRINPAIPRSKEPCMITFEEDSATNPVFVMPCGHSMSPDGLMDYCWNEIGSCRSEIQCPLCNKEWTIAVICEYGCATKTEIHELENGLSRNFCLSDQDILECPSCNSFCERTDPNNLCVRCIICSKKKAKPYHFCWQCLNEWEDSPGSGKCKNVDCGDPALIKQLQDAPGVKPLGLEIEVPKLRACPSCGTLIELKTGCKHMTCKRCKQDFCFVCLRTKVNGSWSCGIYNTPCSPASRQTRIPRRKK